MRERQLTSASKSVAGVSSYTGATVTTWNVGTVGELITVAIVHSTFVNIWITQYFHYTPVSIFYLIYWQLQSASVSTASRLRSIGIRQPQSAFRKCWLVKAFITTRLDYCNGLLANCSVAVRKRIQRIQDSAARLVCSELARSHAAPLLHRLHWLPVHRRITYVQTVRLDIWCLPWHGAQVPDRPV